MSAWIYILTHRAGANVKIGETRVSPTSRSKDYAATYQLEGFTLAKTYAVPENERKAIELHAHRLLIRKGRRLSGLAGAKEIFACTLDEAKEAVTTAIESNVAVAKQEREKRLNETRTLSHLNLVCSSIIKSGSGPGRQKYWEKLIQQLEYGFSRPLMDISLNPEQRDTSENSTQRKISERIIESFEGAKIEQHYHNLTPSQVRGVQWFVALAYFHRWYQLKSGNSKDRNTALRIIEQLSVSEGGHQEEAHDFLRCYDAGHAAVKQHNATNDLIEDQLEEAANVSSFLVRLLAVIGVIVIVSVVLHSQ